MNRRRVAADNSLRARVVSLRIMIMLDSGPGLCSGYPNISRVGATLAVARCRTCPHTATLPILVILGVVLRTAIAGRRKFVLGDRKGRPYAEDFRNYPFAMQARFSALTNRSPQVSLATPSAATRGISDRICSPTVTRRVPSRWPWLTGAVTCSSS